MLYTNDLLGLCGLLLDAGSLFYLFAFLGLSVVWSCGSCYGMARENEN